MNLFEHYQAFKDALEHIQLQSAQNSSFPDKPNYVSGLIELRSHIQLLDGISILKFELDEIYGTWLFKDNQDTRFISNEDKNRLNYVIGLLKLKIKALVSMIEQSEFFDKENLLSIKLPDLTNFEDLAKISVELKKGIEIPIIDQSINGEVKILAGDQGSVILYVSVGSLLAVKLIGAICWSSYVLKRKRAEAKIFEAHAKTLELKNDALTILIEAQKQQLKNILQSEAEAIASKHYSHNDPETVERLKLSITSVSDLVDRGAKILPMQASEDVQNLFPNRSNSALIESSIKQIAGE